MAQRFCQNCGTAIHRDDPIPRDAECESCGRDLRCCMNCRHYDTRYNNACTETEAEPVQDKARRNFCEYFFFNPAPKSRTTGGLSREAEARKKLEDLFKKKS